MPSARFPSNSLRKPKHDKWRGLCHLFFPSLSHKSIKHLKTQESTRTRVPSWLEASGKALVEHCIILLNILFLFLEEIVFFHPIDIRSDYGTCFSQYDVTEVTRATSEQKSLWAGALWSSSLPSPTRSERSQTENFPSAGSLTTWSRGTADPWWSKNQAFVTNAEILGTQHDPHLLRARAPDGVRVTAHPLFGVMLNSSSPSSTIQMEKNLLKLNNNKSSPGTHIKAW